MPNRKFINDNHIVIYRLESLELNELKAWGKLMMQTGDEWTKDKIYRSLHDFRHLTVLTPKLRQQAEEVNEYFLTLNFPAAYIAIVLQPSPLAHLGRIFAERRLRRANNGLIRRIFFDMDSAIAWLESV